VQVARPTLGVRKKQRRGHLQRKQALAPTSGVDDAIDGVVAHFKGRVGKLLLARRVGRPGHAVAFGRCEETLVLVRAGGVEVRAVAADAHLVTNKACIEFRMVVSLRVVVSEDFSECPIG
jgi:hypothetical protein